MLAGVDRIGIQETGWQAADKYMLLRSKTVQRFILLAAVATIAVTMAREEVSVREDSYVTVRALATLFSDEETSAAASGGLGACTPSEISYLRFDLAGLDRQVRNAALSLESTYAGGYNSGSLALYAVPNTLAGGAVPWQETTPTWNNQPGTVGMARLAAVPVPVRAGPLRLGSPALTALVNQRTSSGGTRPGDDAWSLVVQGWARILPPSVAMITLSV